MISTAITFLLSLYNIPQRMYLYILLRIILLKLCLLIHSNISVDLDLDFQFISDPGSVLMSEIIILPNKWFEINRLVSLVVIAPDPLYTTQIFKYIPDWKSFNPLLFVFPLSKFVLSWVELSCKVLKQLRNKFFATSLLLFMMNEYLSLGLYFLS